MKSFIIKTEEQFNKFVEFTNSNWNDIDIVAFDLETNGLDETSVIPWGVGLSFQEDEGYYLVLRDPDGNQVLNPQAVNKFVTHILNNKKWIAHNAIYDALVWGHHFKEDVVSTLHADTILMKHCLDEEPPFGLKEVSVLELGSWADKAQDELYESIIKNGGSTTKTNLEMYKADTDVLGRYCTWDVMLTYKLYNKFQGRLESEGLLKFFYEDEVMPLYREVTIPMKKRGVNLDVDLLLDRKVKIKEVLLSLEDKVQTEIKDLIVDFEKEKLNQEFPVKKTGNFPKFLAQALGEGDLESLSKKSLKGKQHLATVQWLQSDDPSLDSVLVDATQRLMFKSKYQEDRYVFNINSKNNLKWLFFDKLKEEVKGKTPAGEPKVDDEFLESLKGRHSFINTLQEYNVLSKISGTYIDGMLERSVNNTLYTSFLQFGTTSGRFASRNPNLQNYPAPQKTGSITDEFVNSIRHAIKARPGYKLIGADFTSLEPHIAAYVSEDPGLIDIFVTGKDFYSAIAIKQFGLDKMSPFKDDKNYLGELDKATRNKTKTYSLAAFYGAGGSRISQVLGCSIEEAEQLLKGYMEAFPGIKKFIERSHYSATKTGMIKTIFGRVRHLNRCKELHDLYGHELQNYFWARKRNLLQERKEYKNLLNNAVNFQIQGTAGNIMNRAMLLTARRLKENNLDAHIIMTIHDEQIIEVREDQAKVAANIIKESMENAVDLGKIKLKATPIIGNTYGDCK